jgi:hypothetical protein
MNRQFIAAFTAVVLLLTICFPVQVVYAVQINGERTENSLLLTGEADSENDPEDIPEKTPEDSIEAPVETPKQSPEESDTPKAKPEDGDNVAPEPETEEEAPQMPEIGGEIPQGPVPGAEPLLDEILLEETPPLIVERLLLDDKDLRFLPIGGDPETLALPETAYALSGMDGDNCGIQWRYASLDIETPGRQMLTGDIVLPDGYAFEGDPLTVSLPILVYDPAGAPTEQIASCIYSFSDNIIIPLGMDREELPGFFADLFPEADLTTESGDFFLCPVTLDLSLVNPDTAGVYYPIGLDLPGGVEISELLAYYALGVHVVPTDDVSLEAVGIDSFEDVYSVRWLYPAQNPVLWASVDEGEWSSVETQPDLPLLNQYGRFVADDEGVTGLELFFANLSPGHIYKFQVQYDTDRFSKVLVLDLVNNSLPSISTDMGGDRNGGDREENPPPGGGVTTPPPDNGGAEPPSGGGNPPPSGGDTTVPPPGNTEKEPPSTTEPPGNGANPVPPTTTEPPENNHPPAPEPEKPLEEPPAPKQEKTPDGNLSEPKQETTADGKANPTVPPIPPTQTPRDASPKPLPSAPAEYGDSHSLTLSGSRLIAMAQANPATLSFLRDGMRVSVPTAYVTDLALTEADTFTVTLYQPDRDSFAVGFAVNGSPLTEELTEPFSVRIPWNEDAVSCVMEGMDAIPASLDKTSGAADFSLHLPGTYGLVREDGSAIPVVQQATGMPTLAPSVTTGAADSMDEQAPYSDSWMPALLTGLVGLAAAAAFLLWRKRGGGQYGA